MEKLWIIVGGFIGCFPAGGATWDYMQYLLGFSQLGHEVYYIEDTRLYPIFNKNGNDWNDCSSTVAHLSNVMSSFGFNDQWSYRDEASGKSFGLSENAIKDICSTADVFINISCSTFMRDEYKRIPKRVLIDSDPMFTQIQYGTEQMFTHGEPALRQLINDHNYLFTFGENIGSDDCLVPTYGLQWQSTRQPICLNEWNWKLPAKKDPVVFSTVMNWTAGKKLSYEGEEWGQKDVEFKKIMQLPKQISSVSFAMAVNKAGGIEDQSQKNKIENAGWLILDPEECADDWNGYRNFIEQSFGEFSVAKETYVKARTGWFSCRSACYLAAGKPVITQETGWSKFIPVGNGLFTFNDLNDAINSVNEVIGNKQHHIKAAREIAEEYFDSRKVLTQLLNKIV